MKKPKLSATSLPLLGPTLVLASLPSEVVDLVFHFAVEMEDQYASTAPIDDIMIPEALVSIALVSKEWSAVAMALYSKVYLQSVLVTVPMGRSGRTAMLQLRQELTRRRSFTKRLKLTPRNQGQGRVDMGMVRDTLSGIPRLQDLDLRDLRVSIESLIEILRHASGFCVSWNALILPSRFSCSSMDVAHTEASLEALFSACPQLRSLTIAPELQSRFSRAQMRAQDTYTEPFWAALARCCPLLESICIRQDNFKQRTPIALSDSTLQTLGNQHGLRSVRMDFVTLSGDGLFDLVINPLIDKERVFGIQYGYSPDNTFYELLAGFLQRLAEYDGEDLPRTIGGVTLCVKSLDESVERDWSMSYIDDLEALIKTVLAKHSSVYLSVIVDGFHEESKSFESIGEFTFASRPLRRRKACEDVGFAFVRIDDVIVSRVSTAFEYSSESEDDIPCEPDDLIDRYDNRGELGARYGGYRGRPTRLEEYECFQAKRHRSSTEEEPSALP